MNQLLDKFWKNETFRAFIIIGLALHIADMLFGPPAFLIAFAKWAAG